MGGLLSTVAGRRGKWAAVGAWLLIVALALALDLPARYADAQETGATVFLPEGAESTRAIVAQRESGAERTPIVVVYRRGGGLTAEDLRRSRRDLLELRSARRSHPDVYRGVRAFDEPVASHDGDAQLIVADAVSVGGSEGLVDAVTDIRARVSEPTGGLRVSVTGPAGFVADAEEVFETIDARLYLGALLLVVLLLAVIYRSPVLLVLPLVAVGVAELMTRALGFPLAELGVPVTDQSSSIVSVLVLGAGTDYALLLVARYREELRRHADRHEAMALALRAAGPAIVASALTVIAALLCLLLADVPATRGLGPMAALGIAVAMLAMLTLLPALLAIAGRRVFWRPRLVGRDDGIPRFGDAAPDPVARRWRRVGETVAGRPRQVWMATTAALAVMAVGWVAMDTGLTQTEAFRSEVESVAGQRMIADSFSEGAGAPTAVLVPSARFAVVPAVEEALRGVQGVAEVTAGESYPGGVVLDVVLDVDPYSAEAYALVGTLREAARAAGADGVLVGGASAVEADIRSAAAADNRVIAPMTLAVVLAVLIAVLRAVAGPLALIATVVLSFAAAFGFSVLVFELLFGFPGIDPSLPLFAFVFLVALGVDYNIFLMARVREEAQRHGTREGVLRALAVTGGVITSAGVVLAGTFAVLAVLPLVFLTEIGFVIAFGVLLDTLVVRSVLVPAIVLDLDRRTWWPSRLARARRAG